MYRIIIWILICFLQLRASAQQFRQYGKMATDSVVMATWYAEGIHAVSAKVFRAADKNGKYAESAILPVYVRKDTTFVTYSTATKPGQMFSLFLRAEDTLGRTGPASDTIHLLALSLLNTETVNGLTATDTLGGILLRWSPLPAKAYFTGIQVMKSRSATEDYIIADTLPPGATAYIDRKILPGVQYHYTLTPVLFNLKQSGAVTPARITMLANAKPRKIPAPQGVTASFTPAGDVKLHWLPNSEMNIFAYYVLRGTSKVNMQVISGAIRDTVYIDSLKNTEAGTSYVYAINAVDMDLHRGDTSDLLIMQPQKARIVMAPAGLITKTTPGGIKLYWNDVTQSDASVIGYMLYRRKKGDKYFTPLSNKLIPGTYFIDTIATPGIYQYGCAAADASNNQSILSTLAEVTIASDVAVYPPADFNIRNLAAGIEISIPPSANGNASQVSYVIYRRTTNAFKKITEIPSREGIYIDKQVISKQLYVYAISIKQLQTESPKSDEKAIRRK